MFSSPFSQQSHSYRDGDKPFSPTPDYKLKNYSTVITCPRCNNRGYTNVSFKPGNLTFCMAASCSVTGWCTIGLGLCLPWMWFITPFSVLGVFAPYCCSQFGKDAEHRCSKCNLLIDVYRRL